VRCGRVHRGRGNMQSNDVSHIGSFVSQKDTGINDTRKQNPHMTDKRKIRALLSVLSESARSGIHASLSPEDCRILLSMLCPPRQRSAKSDDIINDMQDRLIDYTRDVFDEFFSGFTKKKRKRK